MNSLYQMSVQLTMSVAGMTGPAQLALRALQQVAQQASMTGTSVAGLGKSLALVAGGLAVFGAGLAGVGLLKGWVSAAADLQTAMAGVGLATQGTVAQLKALHDQTFITANKTMFSAVDIAQIEKVAATSGLNQRDVLLRIIPTLGNVAEVDQRLRGIGIGQSIPAAITVAHAFQSYPQNESQTKSFTNLLDLFARSQLVSGATPQTMATLITRLAPARASLGMTPQDVIATAALAMNTGLASGAGGGAGVAALFRTIVPLMSSRGAIHNKALNEVQQAGGGRFFDAKGQFEGVAHMLDVTMRAMGNIHSQQQRLMLLNTAFGAAGGRAFATLATPGAIARFQSIEGLLGPNGIAQSGALQQTLNSPLQGQEATLAGNLTSIRALLGEQLLPVITPVVRGFVQLTGWVVTLLRTHAGLAQFIAIFTLVATAAALIAGPIMVAAGAFAILSAAGIALDVAFLPVTATVLALIAAVAAVTLVIQNWGTITRALGGQLGPFWQGIATGAAAMTPLTAGITAIIGAFRLWSDMTRTVEKDIHNLTATLLTLSHNFSAVPGWEKGAIDGLLRSLPGGSLIAPILGAAGGGHGGGGATGGYTVPQIGGRGNSGGAGGAPAIHIHPGAVAAGAIVVHAQPHHNEQQIANNVFGSLAETLGHAVATGSTARATLMPALRTP